MLGTFIVGIFCKSKIINHITGLGNIFYYNSLIYSLTKKLILLIFRLNIFFFKPIFIFQNKYDQLDLNIKSKTNIIKGSSVNESKYDLNKFKLETDHDQKNSFMFQD